MNVNSNNPTDELALTARVSWKFLQSETNVERGEIGIN